MTSHIAPQVLTLAKPKTMFITLSTSSRPTGRLSPVSSVPFRAFRPALRDNQFSSPLFPLPAGLEPVER